MDDLDDDDIYGDSPTIAKDGIRNPLTQVMTDEQQKQPPPPHRSPQEQTVFRLPGLDLSTGKPSGPDSSEKKHGGPSVSHDSISVHLNGTLPTTKQEQSSVLPSEVKAAGTQAMEQRHGRAQGPKLSQHHDLSLFGQHSALQGLNTTNGQTFGVELEGIETSTVGQDRLAAESCAHTPASEARVPQNVQVDAGGDIFAKEATSELLQQTSPQKENEHVHTQDLLDTSEPNEPIPSQNLQTVEVAKDAKSNLGCQPSNPPRSIDLQAKEKILQTLEEQRSAQSRGVIATVPEGTPTVGGSAEVDERVDEETALEPIQQSSTAPDNDNRLLQGTFPATEPKNVYGVHETGSASPGTTAKEVTCDPAQQPPGPQLGIEQLDDKANTESPEPEQSRQVQGTMAAVSATLKTAENGAEADRKDNEAEFEMDSSPIESSSASDSESSSSAADSDYVMLDPEEEARRLMEEHGGSDDEGKGSKGTSGPLRTLNEKPDEVVPKPQIEVTPAMAIAELGSVEQIVENSILIKAKTSGERQALETASLLCLEDRSVIGVIAETLGQIQQPYYSVRFTNSAAIIEAGIAKGTTIFNVEQHSHYVFTQNIKAFKGSDASNIHDEEVGDDELEFSDDEAEAEHKRRVKQERLAKRGGRSDRSDGFTRGARGVRTQRGGRFNQAMDRDQVPAPISYDEQDDGEDLYTPLARPSNLHEFMGHGEAPQEKPVSHVNGTTRGRDPRLGKPDRGRGRGDRGRGARGGRGDRRGGAGYNSDFSNHQSNTPRQLQHQNHPSHAHPPPHPSSLFNYDPSHPTPQNVNQPGSPYGWSNAYTSNQHNPLYGHSHQQAAPFYQQPAYSNHNPNTYQYPQMNDSQRHGSTKPLATPQSPPLPQHHQYFPHQAASPSIPAPPILPPGAHINPAFFSPTTQQSPDSWPRQQSYGVPPPGGGNRSPQSEAAFLAAQDRLSLLRQLSQGNGHKG